ncbi:MAG: YeeE/YedE family protein [Burkholderiaceae bacterium]
MNINWTAFSPESALTGGLLIGLATALFILLNGRIAGISGIVAGLLKPRRGDRAWRMAFILGLIGAPLVYGLYAAPPTAQIDASLTAVLVAGLLVGLGTRYAGGCTSGHGVCGLSRLSPRSLMATLSFMGAGFVTVLVLRHLLNL